MLVCGILGLKCKEDSIQQDGITQSLLYDVMD